MFCTHKLRSPMILKLVFIVLAMKNNGLFQVPLPRNILPSVCVFGFVSHIRCACAHMSIFALIHHDI